MKKRYFISTLSVFFLFGSLCFGQAGQAEGPQDPATKLEGFLSKKGSLIVKEFYKLGEIIGRASATIEFTAIVMYEPGQEAERVRGLRIDITESGRIEREKSAFLDLDEIKSLIDAIDYMTKLYIEWGRIEKEYVEVLFSTKDEFSIGFYHSGMTQTTFARCEGIGPATCFFASMQDLKNTKNIAAKGLSLLNEK